MAVSVFMRVKARRSVDEIRLFENVGVACAFVLPFIPALVFLIWRPKGYTVYGPAVLWCWISNESNILRLAAFYGPIWLAILRDFWLCAHLLTCIRTIILCSIFFFSLSGRRIIHIRKKVNRAQGIHDDMDDHHEHKFLFSPHRHFSFSNHMPRRTRSNDTSNTGGNHAPFAVGPHEDQVPISPLTSTAPPIPAIYSRHSDSSLIRVQTIEPSTSAGSYEPIVARHQTINSVVNPPIEHEAPHRRRRSTRFDTAHWKYARFALLCTLVLFITWVPISINRVYNNFINPGRPIYGLYFASAMCIPLHGFGNFVIYANTSWEEISTWTKSFFSGKRRLSSSAPGG